MPGHFSFEDFVPPLLDEEDDGSFYSSHGAPPPPLVGGGESWGWSFRGQEEEDATSFELRTQQQSPGWSGRVSSWDSCSTPEAGQRHPHPPHSLVHYPPSASLLGQYPPYSDPAGTNVFHPQPLQHPQHLQHNQAAPIVGQRRWTVSYQEGGVGAGEDEDTTGRKEVMNMLSSLMNDMQHLRSKSVQLKHHHVTLTQHLHHLQQRQTMLPAQQQGQPSTQQDEQQQPPQQQQQQQVQQTVAYSASGTTLHNKGVYSLC